MPPRKLTSKEIAIGERNRANAGTSTGPRTAEGKRRASRNALAHGLRAQTPLDAAEIEDRLQRAEILIATFQPEDAFEPALVHRMAGAFQRLEKADHLESQVFDSALVLGNSPPGRVLANQQRIQNGFTAVNRYRASAQHDLFVAYRLLDAHRQRRDTPLLPNEA